MTSNIPKEINRPISCKHCGNMIQNDRDYDCNVCNGFRFLNELISHLQNGTT